MNLMDVLHADYYTNIVPAALFYIVWNNKRHRMSSLPQGGRGTAAPHPPELRSPRPEGPGPSATDRRSLNSRDPRLVGDPAVKSSPLSDVVKGVMHPVADPRGARGGGC